jgi:hypothetical protein
MRGAGDLNRKLGPNVAGRSADRHVATRLGPDLSGCPYNGLSRRLTASAGLFESIVT